VVERAFGVAATADGRHLVFHRPGADGGRELVRTDADGREAQVLASNQGFLSHPVVTAEGLYVLGISSRSGVQSPWVIPLGGGDATQVSTRYASATKLAVSPDGRTIGFLSRTEIVLCDLPACNTPRTLPLPFNRGDIVLRFTPDGRGIAYIDGTLTNIWVQPLDGSAPRPLTNFTDQTVADFAWSPSGKRLAIARAHAVNDVVLFRGVK
jgi:Tol biopolymer transport system component